MSGEHIKDTVRGKYGEAALRVLSGERASCCGDAISSNLYDPAETAALPERAVLASLGCGNPTALAELHAGETVLDLGSGGGLDVLLSAQRVGPTGRAYGLDMTDEMLALARENQRRAGVVDVAVEPTRIYEFADARAVLTGAGLDAEVLARQVAGRIMGAFIRGRRPA